MNITSPRKGHLEGIHRLQLNVPKSGQIEPLARRWAINQTESS